jgi:hypothetical protein
MGSRRRDECRIKGMTAAVKGAEDSFHCTRGDRQKARAETALRAVRGLLLLEAAARHEIGMPRTSAIGAATATDSRARHSGVQATSAQAATRQALYSSPRR